jgi:alkaline phosphatase
MSTAAANAAVTDSAAATTAMSTGVKTNNRYIAVNPSGRVLDTIMDKAKLKGKATGVVTSDILTGATPAAFSSYFIDRSYYDGIAERQATVKKVDLLLGAKTDGQRTDAAYNNKKPLFLENGYNFVESLEAAKAVTGERLIGVFPNVTPTGTDNAEKLKDMTAFALDWLSIKSENGFVLMVEGAKIDHMSHAKDLSGMLLEFNAFEESVAIVNTWARNAGDTVVIVCADHETGALEKSGAAYIFKSAGHTSADVGCHVYWPFDGKPFDNAPDSGGKIINTNVFDIAMTALMGA